MKSKKACKASNASTMTAQHQVTEVSNQYGLFLSHVSSYVQLIKMNINTLT